MNIKKTSNYEGFEMNEKRMHVPFVITLTCKGCGKELEQTLHHNHYLSYPVIGKSYAHVVYHGEDCGTENVVQIRLDLNLSIVENE